MACNWRWFIHPVVAISTNQNGSRALGISSVHYRQHPSYNENCREFRQIQF